MLSKIKDLKNAQIISKSTQKGINGGLDEDKHKYGAFLCFAYTPGEPCPTGFTPDGQRCCKDGIPFIQL